MKKFTTPSEEWGIFRKNGLAALGIPSELESMLKSAFLSGLLAASDFYQELFNNSKECTNEECQRAYQAWNDGLQAEADKYGLALMDAMMKEKNGRTN